MRKGPAAVQQAELPMKDVTPPKAKAEVSPKKAAPKKAPAKDPAKEPSPANMPNHDGDPRAWAETAQKKPKGTAVAVAQPQAPAQQKNVLAIIADAASNPACNPENMRALLDMQKEIMAEQAKRDFSSAFIALQADLSHVTIRQDGKIEVRKKDASGERTGSVQQATPYATFNNIMKTIQPFLTKHGFELSFSTEPVGERLLVRGYLEGHGHQRTTAFPLPAETSGSKNNVQGWGSSLSYGKRYCTIALLNIISGAPEDRDTDGHPNTEKLKPAKGGGFAEVEPPQKITAAQRDEIIGLMTAAKITEPQFCAKYGVKQIGFLPAELFDAAKKAIAEHAAAKGK